MKHWATGMRWGGLKESWLSGFVVCYLLIVLPSCKTQPHCFRVGESEFDPYDMSDDWFRAYEGIQVWPLYYRVDQSALILRYLVCFRLMEVLTFTYIV